MHLFYDIFFNDNPAAEWVVLIHGFGGSRQIWKKQLPTLKKMYHVLNVDLPGHGESENSTLSDSDLMNATADAIYQTMNENHIPSAHFLGLCIGTVIVLLVAEKYPLVVTDMLLCGAIIGVNGWGGFLLSTANLFKAVISYMWLYRFMAWILMPRKQSRFSRNLFIQSAKKLGRKQFQCWMAAMMAAKSHKMGMDNLANIPKLCLMGEYDHVFINMFKKENGSTYGFQMKIIENSGHLCNIEKASEFNNAMLSFLANGS